MLIAEARLSKVVYSDSANSRNWPVVRPRSPSNLAFGKPVSCDPILVIAAPRASISSTILSKNAARVCIDKAL